jgi:peptide/nickel transport system substrate-binding protein
MEGFVTNRRTFLKATGAAAFAMSMPAIARGAANSVIRFVPQADLATLDPVITSALVTRNHGYMVFDTLWGLDTSYTPQPQMVEGHKVEDDGLTWLLTLRDGLKFHDGSPVLARDVVASVQRWCKIQQVGKTLAAALDEISAPSDKVVRLRMKRPFPILPFTLGITNGGCFIMPERLALTDPATKVTEMVGSGPFKFVAAERNPGQLAVYEKFDGYVPRNGAPSLMAGGKIVNVNRVEWHTMPDAATAAASLMSGEMDWWEQCTPDLIRLLKGDEGISVEVVDKSGYVGQLRFNHLLPPFNNPAMRRALLAGINQVDYMTATMGDDTSLWRDKVGFFPPDTPYASDVGMDALNSERSLDKVKQDLAAAGYNGERVVLLVPTDLPALNSMSQVLGDMLRRVGINVDYQTADWGTVLPRLSSKEPIDKGGWNLWITFTSGAVTWNPVSSSLLRGIGDAGPIGWSKSDRLEELRNQFMGATGLDEQKKIGREIQQQAFEDMPFAPLGFYYQPTAFRKSLTNMVPGSPVFWGVEKA